MKKHNPIEEAVKKQEKGLEFEKKVAEFFRRKGYKKVLLREKIQGKSGIKHEVDVLVFDNLDPKRPLWACQCKYWNTQVGIKEIGEWIQTCRDIGIESAFASLRFSSEAKKYAEAYGVYLITDEQLGIKPTQVFGENFLSWKEKLDTISNDIDKILFCLKGIYQTELLQDAERARNEPDEELRFEEPQLFKLFRDPNDQQLTKFLIYLNKIKGEYGPSYAFGSLEDSSLFKISSVYTDAFNIPSEVGKVNKMIHFILERMKTSDLEPFKMGWGDKCRIFLEGWLQLSKVDLLNQVCPYFYTYTCYSISKCDPNLKYDRERRLLIGIPTKEYWKNHFNKIRNLWRSILEDKTAEEIKRLGKLFQTDLSVVNKEDKLPYIELDSKKKCEICNIFIKSRIIKKAYKNNKSKVEKIISDLRTTV